MGSFGFDLAESGTLCLQDMRRRRTWVGVLLALPPTKEFGPDVLFRWQGEEVGDAAGGWRAVGILASSSIVASCLSKCTRKSELREQMLFAFFGISRWPILTPPPGSDGGAASMNDDCTVEGAAQ